MTNELSQRSQALYGDSVRVCRGESDGLERGRQRGWRQLIRRRVLGIGVAEGRSRQPGGLSAACQPFPA